MRMSIVSGLCVGMFTHLFLPHVVNLMTEHTYDHVMAWSSLWILFPLFHEHLYTLERGVLAGVMVVFTLVSVQYWRQHSLQWLHALDVAFAHIVFLWHVLIAQRTLEASEWTSCVSYGSISAAVFLANEFILDCRTRAVSCGGKWRWRYIVPHATFRYYAFAMVMTARGAPWTWQFVVSYVSSLVLLGRYRCSSLGVSKDQPGGNYTI